MDERLEGFDIPQFREDLIEWFKANQRVLPWRESNDPYRVWVSEIMLQQTRVDTVIPYYQAFMRKFPTVEALAMAEEDDVLKAWEGLGYYSRARNLQTAVREVVEQYGGIVPDTREELSKLKGVGPYTTGAILSIAYQRPEPAVDGNVMRVLSRILLIGDDIAKATTRKQFEQLIYEIISQEDPSSFNQGLMELGALVCTPISPGCLLCPVRAHCRANAQGVQETLPVKAKKKKPKRKQMAAVVIRNERGDVLIEKRPSEGLLAGLWQFPNIETDSKTDQVEQLKTALTTSFDLQTDLSGPVQTVEHVFSHLIWNITVYEVEVDTHLIKETETRHWVDRETIERYTFPVSYQKIIQHSL